MSTISLILETFSSGRKKITIRTELDANTQYLLSCRSIQTLFLESEIPVPGQLYSTEKPEINTPQRNPKWNGLPYRCFYFPKAKKTTTSSPIPKKTAVTIPTPGDLELGFISEKDEAIWKKWWETIKPNLKAQILGEANKEKKETVIVSEKTENWDVDLSSPSTLNMGIRKRNIEEF
jgi:hypothetical protein